MYGEDGIIFNISDISKNYTLPPHWRFIKFWNISESSMKVTNLRFCDCETSKMFPFKVKQKSIKMFSLE